MAEREANFAALIGVLRQAQDAVHRELELLQAQEFDREALIRLLTSVRSFADQAMSLFMMMADIGSDEASTREVGDLAESFLATEDLIEMALGLHRL